VRKFLVVGTATAIAAAVAVPVYAASRTTPTPHDRAVAIVARMALDEKISQLHGIRTSTEFRTVPAIPRLGIPKLLLTNGPAGVSTGGITQPSATALPAPIALAASWDLRQATAYGALAARSFSYWSTSAHGWKITGGRYQIRLGGSSRNQPLSGTVTLAAA
jgi:beta-glucosidase